MSYAALSPTNLIAMGHFGCALLIYRYVMLFVHGRIMGKQGLYWPFLSDTVMTSLLCLQVCW